MELNQVIQVCLLLLENAVEPILLHLFFHRCFDFSNAFNCFTRGECARLRSHFLVFLLSVCKVSSHSCLTDVCNPHLPIPAFVRDHLILSLRLQMYARRRRFMRRHALLGRSVYAPCLTVMCSLFPRLSFSSSVF